MELLPSSRPRNLSALRRLSQPRDLDALANISGVGAGKLERYGREVIAALQPLESMAIWWTRSRRRGPRLEYSPPMRVLQAMDLPCR